MRVLITGRGGTAGSWQVRGEQLGAAIGATVRPDAGIDTMKGHDVIVAVKRVTPSLAARLHSCGKPVIWDCVDWYTQPNNFSREELVAQAKTYAAAMGAKAMIGATLRMAADIGTPYFVPHHGWDRGIAKTRTRVTTVGYEGSHRYIEALRPQIEAECAARGWEFVVNPPDYLALDIVLALRSPEWTNYASRHWKSGVKLSNAQIAGVPFIGARECGYTEQACGAECWADTPEELSRAFDALASADVRAAARAKMTRAAPTLADVAAAYRLVLAEVA